MSNYSFYFCNSTIDMSTNSLESYEFFVVDATNGDIDIKLHLAYYDGMCFQFLRVDNSNHIVTFSCQQGNNIDGNSNKNFPNNRYVQCISYNNSWLCPLIAYN